VPFMHEAIRYLSGARAAASNALVGDPASSVATETPGVRAVESAGRSSSIAVNVDPRESDPGRMSPDEFRGAVTRMKDEGEPSVRLEARQQEDRQHVWQYVLMFMVGMLVTESFVARRTA